MLSARLLIYHLCYRYRCQGAITKYHIYEKNYKVKLSTQASMIDVASPIHYATERACSMSL
jgi:hypothetical protein